MKTVTKDKKDWVKKYHKIIQEIERMLEVYIQLQNIVKLEEEANTQVIEIKNTILQVSDNYRTQISEDIFCISKDL